MADEIDIANDAAERSLAAALKNKAPEPRGPAGRCLSCNRMLPAGRFCDADCRDDWEVEQRAAVINGRRLT